MRSLLYAVAALALAPAGHAVAQAPAALTLSNPSAVLSEGFTQITSVRELSDGRVYVSDRLDKSVSFVDLQRGTATKVGRLGAGPGEFGVPGRLFALKGDTTLLYDPQNGRFLVLLAGGKIGPVRSADTPDIGSASVRFVDEGGRIYLTASPWGAAGDAQSFQAVVRYDPIRKHADTLARVGQPEGRMEGAATLPGGKLRLMNNRPLAKEDAVAFVRDGRVAVVRGADYHVEWFGGGAAIGGPPVTYRPIPVSTAEKRAFLEGLTVPGQITVSGGGGMATAMPMPPGMARPTVDTYDDKGMEWPTQKPAFVGNAAIGAPDGTLWVLRTRAHDDSVPRYDLFDGRGRLTASVALPKRSRVVGFGTVTVFVAMRDQDDLEQLQRFRRPDLPPR